MDFGDYEISEWMYKSIKGIFKTLLILAYSVKSYNLEYLDEIPKNTGFVIAANHGSIVDAFVMGLEIDSHKVRFIGRQRTLWSNPIFGKLNDILGTIPVPERIFRDKSLVIKAAVKALKQGACVGIYPEGAILKRRKKFEGKTGAARMILEAGVPIVPVGILGTDGLWPYGAKMPRLGRPVQMYVGKPLYFDEFYGMHNNFEVVKYVTDVVMREIRRLSGWYDVPNEIIIKMYEHYANLKKPEI